MRRIGSLYDLFWGYRIVQQSSRLGTMLLSEQKGRFAVVILFTCSLQLHASTTPIKFYLTPSKANSQIRSNDDALSISKSLRNDVANHPNDFITFETETGANQFIVKHRDACRESEQRVIQRGIVGYWEGKTLVVLPSLFTAVPW